jgi:hypothetical protein
MSSGGVGLKNYVGLATPGYYNDAPVHSTVIGPGRVNIPIGPTPPPVYEPPGQGQVFDQFNSNLRSPAYYSPFAGIGTGPNQVGSFNIYGGKSDLLPSISTRRLANQTLLRLMNRSAGEDAGDINAGMAQFAANAGGGQIGDMTAMMAPGVQSSALLEDVKNKRAIEDLMGASYVQGAGIKSAAEANTGGLVQWLKANRLNKINKGIGPFAGIPFIGGVIGGFKQ